MKDCQHDMDVLNLAREEMASAAKENEKQLKILETELLQARQELQSSEKARKDLQAAKDELMEELRGTSK